MYALALLLTNINHQISFACSCSIKTNLIKRKLKNYIFDSFLICYHKRKLLTLKKDGELEKVPLVVEYREPVSSLRLDL